MDFLLVMTCLFSFVTGTVALVTARAATTAIQAHQKTIAALLKQQTKLVLAVKAVDVVQAEVAMHNVDVDAGEVATVPTSIVNTGTLKPPQKKLTQVTDGARRFSIFSIDPDAEADFANFDQKEDGA